MRKDSLHVRENEHRLLAEYDDQNYPDELVRILMLSYSQRANLRISRMKEPNLHTYF